MSASSERDARLTATARRLALLCFAAFLGCGGSSDPDAGMAAQDGGDVDGAVADGASGDVADSGGATLAFDNLDALDQAALRRAAEGYAHFEEGAAPIWTDEFAFDELPMILLHREAPDAGHAFLINLPDDSGVEVALPEELTALAPVLRVERLSRYPANESIFEFHFDYAERDAFLVVYSSNDEPDFAVTTPFWVNFLVHEAFHRYQDDGQWQWPSSMTQDTTNYPLDAENAALTMVEDRALAQALRSTGDARQSAIEDFVRVRNERLSRWEIIEHLDESQEKLEGCARYIEIPIDSLSGQDGADLLRFQVEESATPEYLMDSAGFYLSADRYYLSGAAIGLLLDDQMPDWKARVPDSANTPASLLRELLTLEPDAMQLAQVLERYNHSQALSQAENFDYTPRELPPPGSL